MPTVFHSENSGIRLLFAVLTGNVFSRARDRWVVSFLFFLNAYVVLFTLNIIMSDDCFRVLNCLNFSFFTDKQTQHCIESAIMFEAAHRRLHDATKKKFIVNHF